RRSAASSGTPAGVRCARTFPSAAARTRTSSRRRRSRSRSDRMAASLFIVGIDLGTTNTACAYVDSAADRAIRVFEIPQLVAPGEVRPRPTLPSFLYLAGPHDVPPGSLDLPWAPGRDFCVGLFAREQGARVPGRLVASAKSWLCHGGVDRTAGILPWGAPPDVSRVSPVEASARILAHVREAWDAAFPAPLAEQDVVLT